MIPGLVFGGLALIACALFILWGIYACGGACCRRCCRKRKRGTSDDGAHYVSSEDVLPAAEVGRGATIVLLWGVVHAQPAG